MMNRLRPEALLVLAAILACPAGRAQTAAADPQTAALLKKAEELERGLTELKAELARRGAAVTAATAAVPAAPLAAEPAPPPAADTPSLPGPATEGHTLGPVQLRGFSDLGYGRALFEKMPEQGLHGSPQAFTIGDFDLFATSQITDHISFLGEMLITSDFSNSFGAELDRLMLTYKANDYFKISAGKYNTAIGFYTNNFHRARFFQTATGRPMLFSDEDNGGVLPVHSIGLSATGKIPSGSLGLHWVAELANGRSATAGASPIQNFTDENSGKAYNLALYAKPEWLHGLQTGGSFYRDMLYPTGHGAVRQSIYSAYAAFVSPHTEFIAEGVVISHQDLRDLRDYHTASWYVQAGRQFGQFRPYLRYEYQNVPTGDVIFPGLGRRNGPSAGVRFDLSAYAAFKVQYGRLGVETGKSTNDLHAQLAFAF